jgi:hypothetical protein
VIAGIVIGGVVWLAMVGASFHPAVGALVYGILLVPNLAHSAHGPALPVEVILPLVMCLLLVVQAGAIRTARRRSGSGLSS